jgi:hypothetical protein
VAALSKFYFSKIGIVRGGVQLGPIGTAATNWPIVSAPGEYDDGEIAGMIGRRNRSTRRKPAPMLLCPPQTPHAAQTRTRAAAVGSQRLKPRGLRHELSSPARTLGSLFRIPFDAWMCVLLFCLCCPVCRQRSCNWLIFFPRSPTYDTEKAARAQHKAVESWKNEWILRTENGRGRSWP